MPMSKLTLKISNTLLFLGAFANTYLLNYSHILYLNVKLFTADEVSCSVFIQCTAQQLAFTDTTTLEIKCKQKGTKHNMKQRISNSFQGIENDSSVWLWYNFQKNSQLWFEGFKGWKTVTCVSHCKALCWLWINLLGLPNLLSNFPRTPQSNTDTTTCYHAQISLLQYHRSYVNPTVTGLHQEGHIFVHLVS